MMPREPGLDSMAWAGRRQAGSPYAPYIPELTTSGDFLCFSGGPAPLPRDFAALGRRRGRRMVRPVWLSAVWVVAAWKAEAVVLAGRGGACGVGVGEFDGGEIAFREVSARVQAR